MRCVLYLAVYVVFPRVCYKEEYDELLRYAVVVPSYPHLPSLTTTASTLGGPSPAVGHSIQTASSQAWHTGGVHVVASTEAGSIAAQTDVVTVHPTTYVEPSVSSRSSVHGSPDSVHTLLVVLLINVMLTGVNMTILIIINNNNSWQTIYYVA